MNSFQKHNVMWFDYQELDIVCKNSSVKKPLELGSEKRSWLKAFFPHDFEGSKDSLVLTSRSVTYVQKGFIRRLEDFHPLSHDVHILLKRQIKSYIFHPLCHDAHMFLKRRIKSYIFSSKLS